MAVDESDKWLAQYEKWQASKLRRRPQGERQQCRNCIYWNVDDASKEHTLIHGGDPDDVYAECHRHAPRPDQYLITSMANLLGSIAWAVEEEANIKHQKDQEYWPHESTSSHEVWQWPKTQAYDWCGDFVDGRKTPSEEEIADDIKSRDELRKEWQAKEKA